MLRRICLIGDYDPGVTAHRGIDKSLAGIAEAVWLGTPALLDAPLGEFAGFWSVPASPYESMEGALRAIRFAREHGRPFLGTCGGFQHAILEYAQNVWGIAGASHAEVNPESAIRLIAPLSCALIEAEGTIRFEPHSRMASIYGATEAREMYHCSYGFNPEYRSLLNTGPLRVSGLDDHGEIRAVELDGHPFFMATLFQPERRALHGEVHPLVRAFVAALRDPVEHR
jgi:CTP synthase (UTP-ammonia lyase)